MTLFEKINSPEFIQYWDTVAQVSKNSSGIPLCQSDKEIFFYEKYHDANRFTEHNVDSVMIKVHNGKYTVYLLEFKGGITPENWDKDCFALKAFDTIHCGLSKLIDNFDEWNKIFSCKLMYYIICSDDNIIFSEQLPSNEQFRKRPQIIQGRQQLDKMQGSLERYNHKRPFDKILVTCSTIFLRDIVNTVSR